MPAHRTKPVVPSESKILLRLIGMLEAVLEGDESPQDMIAFVIDKLRLLAKNAEAGLHANPGALVVYGNPPQGENRLALHTLLGFAEQVKYRRTKRPTGDYFHDFGPDDAVWAAEMWSPKGRSVAVARVIVIANADGTPLWGEQ